MKKIFLTGASGYIGGTTAQLLVKKGYTVAGLIRRAELAPLLQAQGIRPVIGSTDDIQLLTREAQAADAVIHTTNVSDPVPINTFINALKATGKTLIHTSGSSVLGKRTPNNFIYTEDFPIDPIPERVNWVGLNNTVVRAAEQQIRSIVIIPTMIYGEGLGIHKESIQLPLLWKASQEKGAGVYIESGAGIWSNAHVLDLAQLYIDALEKAAAGTVFYVENGAASFKEIAAAMSRKMGKGDHTISISLTEAIDKWGEDMATFGLCADSRASAVKAKAMLGWQPVYNSIFEHI